MRKVLAVVVFCLCTGLAVSDSLFANPTGAPLFTFPVKPCRIMDTRVSMGPLPDFAVYDVHVRGSQLPASEGAARSDCKVPPSAEAVIVNVTVVSPTGNGYLRVNAFGETSQNSYSPYSRLTYRMGQNIANEMVVDLCNIFLYPAPHEPCGFNGSTYSDFSVLNTGTAGSSVHLVIDVVGYLARMPDPENL